MRSREDLLDIAGRYANQQRAPAAAITKEILHYEILYALLQSEALAHLVFQGGTSLRLCYQGNRYSEDLDFAGGRDFDPAVMAPFGELLTREIGEAYGLKVDIREPKVGALDADSHVAVARWAARVTVPNPDPSVRQSQLIKIEVASVPAYDVDLRPVSVNYPHLPAPFSQMLLPVESMTEILADKIVALGARQYFKARDIWDIKFLLDKQVAQGDALALVGQKLQDYGFSPEEFKGKLGERIAQLQQPETGELFRKEMSRFVDASIALYLGRPEFAGKFLQRSVELAQYVATADLAPPPAPPGSGIPRG